MSYGILSLGDAASFTCVMGLCHWGRGASVSYRHISTLTHVFQSLICTPSGLLCKQSGATQGHVASFNVVIFG